MKIRNLFTLLAFLFVSTVALAGESNITVEPGKAYTMVLTDLENGIKYDLSCAIHGNGNGFRKNSVQIVGSDKIQMFLVNGEDVSATDGNADLKFPLNSMKAIGVYQGAVVMVRNTSRYDSIIVVRCDTTPISN